MDDDVDPLSETTVEFVEHAVEEEHGYLSWLGTTVDDVERGRIVLSIPYDETLTNPTTPPTVNGGVAATLVDTAGGLAVRSCLPDPLAGDAATVTLSVNYLRRATGTLRAEAEVVRAGSSIGVAAVEVTSTTPDGEQRPVATGQPAYRIFRAD